MPKTDYDEQIEQTIKNLGDEKINCLKNLFKKAEGEPPSVPKKKYRADQPQEIQTLNYLEDSVHLIESNQEQKCYYLRPYALPLIEDKKAKGLVHIMCNLYKSLKNLYPVYLDQSVTIETILDSVASPREKTLDAMYYMSGAHGVWQQKSSGFPYKSESSIVISEDVLIKNNFLEILTDYYRWHFINPKDEISPNNLQRLFSVKKESGPRFFTAEDTNGHPPWFDRLGETERALIIEIDRALELDLKALSVMGIRALLENMMVGRIEDQGKFLSNIKKFFEAGYITSQHQEILSSVYETGSAVMHRSYVPSAQSVRVCIEVIKYLMHGIYILKPEVDKLHDEIPARKQRA